MLQIYGDTAEQCCSISCDRHAIVQGKLARGETPMTNGCAEGFALLFFSAITSSPGSTSTLCPWVSVLLPESNLIEQIISL